MVVEDGRQVIDANGIEKKGGGELCSRYSVKYLMCSV